METDINKLRKVLMKMHQVFREVVMQLQTDTKFIYHCSSTKAIFSILKYKNIRMVKEGRYIEFPWHEYAKSSLTGVMLGRNVENKKQIKKEIREILSELDLSEVKISY